MFRYLLAKINHAIRALLVGLIIGYRYTLSPLLGPRCRFYPSCSEYAKSALSLHSLPHALWLISKRLLKCQPWHAGGYDPVPGIKDKVSP